MLLNVIAVVSDPAAILAPLDSRIAWSVIVSGLSF